MEKTKLTTIKPESVISVKISGAFYSRLMTLLDFYSRDVEPEVFMNAMVNIKSKIDDEDVDLDPYAFSLETLLILINSLELQFKAQGKTTVEEVNYEPDDESRANLKDDTDTIIENFEG